MRWVVELPAPSGGTAATVTVDADSWAGALTHARGGSPIKKFRCEFDADNVVRVLDLSSREWYTIRPIRAVSPEANSAPPPAAPAPEPAQQAPAPQPFALARDEETAPPVTAPTEAASPAATLETPPSAEVRAVAAPEAAATEGTVPPTVEAAEPASPSEPAPAQVVDEPVPAASARPTDTLFGVPPARNDESRLVAVDESGEHQALPGGMAPPTLLFERDQEPSESNPLAYRERVFVVPEGTKVGDAELVARHALTALRRSLATHPRGRYVVVAVFDHRFETRPLRPALVEVRWKDWRGDVEVTHPAPTAAATVNGSTHADASGSVDVSAVVAASASAPEEAPAQAAPLAETPASAPVEPPPTETPAAFVAAAVEAPAADLAPEAPAPVAEVPAAAPVVETAAHVVEAPASVVEAPASVVEAPAPVVEAPAPVVETPATVDTVVVAPLEPSVATLPPPSELSALSEASPVVEPSAAPAPSLVAATDDTTTTSTPEAPSKPVSNPPEVAQAPSVGTEAAVLVAPEAAATSSASTAPAATVEGPAPRRAPRTIARRLRGKDLLSELFDALMDLSHKESADAGSKQVVLILQEHVQCDLAAVSLYDIDRDEFVVNAAFGADGVVGRRERAKVGVASTVVKRKAGVTLASCGADDVIHDDLREGGGVFAPAMFRERLFALVRVHRVPGADAFETDELDALSYVAAQLGEFLSTQSKRAAAAEFAPEPRRSQAPPRR